MKRKSITKSQPRLRLKKHKSEDDEEIARDYNSKNRLVTKEFIESTLQKFTGCDIRIFNLELYQQAFVHNSVYKKDISPPKHVIAKHLHKNSSVFFGTWNRGKPLVFRKTYESLEFMGDGWIGCVVGSYLYHRFKNQNEGFLTTLKNKLVQCSSLAHFASYVGLDKYVLISYKYELNSGRSNESVLEDVFEAFCGAIIQDLGFPILEIFIKNILELAVDFNDLIMNDDNYKDILLRYFQKNGWGNPTYTVINEDGPPHQRIFTVGVDYFEILRKFGISPMVTNGDQRFLALGAEKSKKKAEQNAAEQALNMLDMIAAVNVNKKLSTKK